MSSPTIPSDVALAGAGADDAPTVVTVTPKALAMVLEARSGEADADTLSLWLEANPAPGGKFRYDMWFEATSAAPTDAVIVALDGVSLVVPAASVPRLAGSTLDLATDGSGMVLINPNEPAEAPRPSAIAEGADLSTDLAKQILEVIETQVNPSIASHGGYAQLVGAEGDTVWIRMGGGCQGCASSKLTLRQGIEVAIKQAVPAISNVVDVTDHQAGDNPYYR